MGESLVDRVLGNPDGFPDAFKSWIPRVLEDNPLLKLTTIQMPTVDKTHYIGASGEPVFQNSWVNYGVSNEAAGFYKDPFGRVFLTGLVKSGTTGTTIFTLPGGYRPKLREIFAVISGNPTDVLGRIDIDGNGNVIHVTGGNTYHQLSGISFRAF